MHRRPLLALIERYAQRYPAEKATITRFHHFVATEPRCFERSHLPGHVTGSAWIINAANTHTLLTHHRKLDAWLQLGGHADGEADILAVALKEAEEESGLTTFHLPSPEIFDLDIHLIPARPDTPAHLHYDVRFLLQTTGDETFTISPESHNLAWVPAPDLPTYTQEPSMLRMRQKWLH